MDLTLFGLRPNKSKTIRQKNLKKIKFYHVGLLNILINSLSCAPDSAEGTGSSGLLVFPVLSGPPPPPPMCTGLGEVEVCA
jgi:hypothetical protein